MAPFLGSSSTIGPVAGRFRPTWAEVSVGAYAANVRALKALVGPPTRLMAVLKADAYGHGASTLAPVALQSGADLIGVSSIEEGVALREAGIKAPIVLLGSVFPLENFVSVLEARLTPSVFSLEAAHHLAAIAQVIGQPASFHLKVDTGMGRLGLSPQRAREVLAYVAGEKSLRLAGLYSHLASADSDPDFTTRQLRDFLAVTEMARALGFNDTACHLANSAGAIAHAETRLDLVRPGIALLGAPPVATPPSLPLQPVLSWKTHIVFRKRVPAGTSISYGRKFRADKEMEIATLPVGYADGVPRAVFNKARVLIRGLRRPVLGVVTMDHIMVDVTGLGVDVGEEVVLIGKQGGDEITAGEWASWAGTISYEIFCGISKRVPRTVVS